MEEFVRAANEPEGNTPVFGRPEEVTAQHLLVALSLHIHCQPPVHFYGLPDTLIREHQGTKPAVENPILITFFTFQ